MSSDGAKNISARNTTNECINRNCSEEVSHKSLSEPEPRLSFSCCLKCETLSVTSRKTIWFLYGCIRRLWEIGKYNFPRWNQRQEIKFSGDSRIIKTTLKNGMEFVIQQQWCGGFWNCAFSSWTFRSLGYGDWLALGQKCTIINWTDAAATKLWNYSVILP